jgi:hypothetical protein
MFLENISYLTEINEKGLNLCLLYSPSTCFRLKMLDWKWKKLQFLNKNRGQKLHIPHYGVTTSLHFLIHSNLFFAWDLERENFLIFSSKPSNEVSYYAISSQLKLFDVKICRHFFPTWKVLFRVSNNGQISNFKYLLCFILTVLQSTFSPSQSFLFSLTLSSAKVFYFVNHNKPFA